MMTPDSSADTRSDRLSLDMVSVHQHQQERQHHLHHHHGQPHQQDHNCHHQPQLHNQAYSGHQYHSPPYPLLPTPLEEHGQTFPSNTTFEHGLDQTEIVSAPGGRLKRENRHVSLDIPPTASGSVAAKDAGMPAKKKAKTDSSKKGENDTASLFQKICKFVLNGFLLHSNRQGLFALFCSSTIQWPTS